METIRITITTVEDGGYILVREVGPLRKELHRQAFGCSEHGRILAVIRQMLTEIDADD